MQASHYHLVCSATRGELGQQGGGEVFHRAQAKPVAQEVGCDFFIGTVGHVGKVCVPAVGRRHFAVNVPDPQATEAIHLCHPLGVSLGEVIVKGNHVAAPPSPACNNSGHGGSEGLTFAGSHFGNASCFYYEGAGYLGSKRLLV